MAQTRCGFCNHDAHMQPRFGHGVRTGGAAVAVEAAFTCANCGRINMAFLPSAGGSPFTNPNTADAEFLIRGSAATWFPRSVELRTFADVPTHIAESASEAYSCNSVGAHRAAVLMARTVLEATAKAKGIVTGGLIAKIDNLREQNLIRPDIADAAHEIRLDGNNVAHGDIEDRVTSEEAEEILELMTEVLAEVFQGPARLAARRARREAAKASGN